jgi:hypothetical protein
MKVIKKTQDPKYDIIIEHELIDGKSWIMDAYLVNAATGVRIPTNEPIFIFRAKDTLATRVLDFYLDSCKSIMHRACIVGRLAMFKIFKEDLPERMKEPA